MNILVVYGGDSPERAVSIRSGKAVASALRSRHRVIECELGDDFGILDDYLQNIDLVMPILHGLHGEDGSIQKYLEEKNVVYLGANSEVSKVTFDKWQTRQALEAHNVKMPRAALIDTTVLQHPLLSSPFVLKPYNGGSSIDIVIARTVDEGYIDRSRDLLNKYQTMLLEELIVGQEITVAVVGDRALPPIAINPPAGAEFDYENKYNGKSGEICPIPLEVVSEPIQKKAMELALYIHNILGVRHFSRTDMIITENGEIYVLEINTIPGMTEQSLVPKAATAEGKTMEELCSELVTLAMKG